MTEARDLESVVEAILFVATDPVPRDKLLAVFEAADRGAAERAVEAVVDRYREREDRGVRIDQAAGGLRLVTRPDLHGYLRRYFEVTGSNRLSMAAVETLAIVAYRQPITAPEIQELRGVSGSGVLKTLLERRLVRIAGRKPVVGKPFLYATTRHFLMRFGLESLDELPPLEELEELLEAGEADPPPGPDTEEAIRREVAAFEEHLAEGGEEMEASERAAVAGEAES